MLFKVYRIYLGQETIGSIWGTSPKGHALLVKNRISASEGRRDLRVGEKCSQFSRATFIHDLCNNMCPKMLNFRDVGLKLILMQAPPAHFGDFLSRPRKVVK